MNKNKKITAKTKIKIIAEKYGVDFGNDNEKEVGEFLVEKGYKSLAKLLGYKKK